MKIRNESERNLSNESERKETDKCRKNEPECDCILFDARSERLALVSYHAAVIKNTCVSSQVHSVFVTCLLQQLALISSCQSH